MENKPLTMSQSTSLADLLERVLDKGVVIAGDITVLVADVELLTIKIRLLVASVDKAMEIGVNWWQNDPYLNTRAKQLVEHNRELEQEVAALRNATLQTVETRLDALEAQLEKAKAKTPRKKSEKP